MLNKALHASLKVTVLTMMEETGVEDLQALSKVEGATPPAVTERP